MANEIVLAGGRSIGEVVQMTLAVQQAMKEVMVKDTHYGVIPGCGDKPALLKAGAEMLSMLFRLSATPKVEIVDLGEGHREYRIQTEIRQIGTGDLWGVGVGSCSTKESKYRWRKLEKVCPECGKNAIIKGKKEYGGGWVCFGKKGGCGAKFRDGDQIIESQEEGRAENPDIADVFNTVFKIAKKRSLVDAILTATGASGMFTQDIDELAEANERLNPHRPAAIDAEIVETHQPEPKPAAKPEAKPVPTPPREADSDDLSGALEELGALFQKIDGKFRTVADLRKSVNTRAVAWKVTPLNAMIRLRDDAEKKIKEAAEKAEKEANA